MEPPKSPKGFHLVTAEASLIGSHPFGYVRHTELNLDLGLFIARRSFPRITDEIERGRLLVPQGWYKHYKGSIYWVVDTGYFMDVDRHSALGVVYYPRTSRHEWYFRPMEGTGGWLEPAKTKRNIKVKRFTPIGDGTEA